MVLGCNCYLQSTWSNLDELKKLLINLDNKQESNIVVFGDVQVQQQVRDKNHFVISISNISAGLIISR